MGEAKEQLADEPRLPPHPLVAVYGADADQQRRCCEQLRTAGALDPKVLAWSELRSATGEGANGLVVLGEVPPEAAGGLAARRPGVPVIAIGGAAPPPSATCWFAAAPPPGVLAMLLRQ